MLRASGISFSYDHRQVLHAISLEIKEGEILGIIGPNGAGKSTLIKIMSGILKPRTGTVDLSGISIHALSEKDIARSIAVVSQQTSIIFPYRVMEVVLMGRYVHAPGALYDRETDVSIARNALEQVDASDFATRYYNQLSGGEQQLVIIARALAQQTPILLLDEPSSALDLKHMAFIARLLARLAHEHNKAVVITGHNINYLGGFCDRLAVMKHGALVKEGNPGDIITPNLIADVYETAIELFHDNAGHPLITLKLS